VLDLFETEDWWTVPAQPAAIVAGNRLVAVRGDKQMPLPDAPGARPRARGRARLALPHRRAPGSQAAWPSPGSPRKGELTFLVFGVPFDAALEPRPRPF
jgi:hypothetical protein